MSRHVLVIGGGFAGVAAAVAARGRGARVSLVTGRAGASSLAPGVLDDQPWDELERAARAVAIPLVAGKLGAGVAELAELFGLYRIAESGEPCARHATMHGFVRTARASDVALLDLSVVEGRTLLVPRADRAGWDADSLAHTLAEACPGLAVEVVTCPVLRYDEERRISDTELAARHDEADRRDWLAERLRREVARRPAMSAAFLLGPWLGAECSRAADLSERVGAPVGEALAVLAGTAGLRFEHARQRLLEARDVAVLPGEVSAIRRSDGELEVALDARFVRANAIVLATGGLVGGGVVYDPPEHAARAHGADHARPPFRLNLTLAGAHVSASLDHGVVGSIEGPTLDADAWPSGLRPGALERAGIHVGASGSVAPGIYPAGDVVFGSRRTAFAAIASGLAAGSAAAAREPSRAEASQPSRP